MTHTTQKLVPYVTHHFYFYFYFQLLNASILIPPQIKTMFSSFNPAYHTHAINCDKDVEFDFWGARKELYQSEGRDGDDDDDDFSPRLWKANKSRMIEYEFSPLLAYNYHHHQKSHSLSPRTRSRAIQDGRKELMEMISNVPEFNYELSLTDIVEQTLLQGEVKDEEEEEVFIEAKMKKQKKKSQISRGVDNEIFLIKFFTFPRSLGSKKNTTTTNKQVCSHLDENHNDEETKASGNTTREAEITSSPGCWPVFRCKNSKTRRQRGCFF